MVWLFGLYCGDDGVELAVRLVQLVGDLVLGVCVGGVYGGFFFECGVVLGYYGYWMFTCWCALG